MHPPTLNRRLRIGLTGGIASGKTTAAQRFIELGVAVIDADEAARAVVAPGQAGLAAVVAKFGSGVLGADGELNRRALRDLVFSEPALRRELEDILHPLIRAAMEQRAAAAGGPYVVMAIPLLVEGGDRKSVDRILVIDIDPETQLERVMVRDSCGLTQARAIIGAQASRAARLAAADDVILNSGTVPELRGAVDELHRQYLSLSESSPAAR
jgi:dephospho-CoA kinase